MSVSAAETWLRDMVAGVYRGARRGGNGGRRFQRAGGWPLRPVPGSWLFLRLLCSAPFGACQVKRVLGRGDRWS